MNANKINTQIERLEEELAKLKAEANKPSKYELEYERGDAFLVGSYGVTNRVTGKNDDYLKTGRYRSTEKFANEHFNIQAEMMRLGALIEAVTIGMNMEDWVADWNDEDQYKCCVNICDNRYVAECWVTTKTIGAIYVPEEVAIRVCEILNNKEYEL
jgi:hypothetical protein